MTLYLFNPSHDEALAAGSPYYYPSTIARRLEVEWGALPALWATSADAVWLPDALPLPEGLAPGQVDWQHGVRFVHRRQLTTAFWQQVDRIEPWGWDPLVRHKLRKAGAPEHLLPGDAQLQQIATLSSRETTARLLPQLLHQLRAKGVHTVGESVIARSAESVDQYLQQWQGAMAKALWSCSGRGVFRVANPPTASEHGRLQRLLREQGGLELEPYYSGMLDFALEFEVQPAGKVLYCGLSVFGTNASGAYRGNRVAPQSVLEAEVCSALGSRHAYEEAVQACLSLLPSLLGNGYVGPLGIDMMVVATPYGPALLPCVELNLRRTMGHVSLNVVKLTLKAAELPMWLRNLCYFCD